MAIFVIEVVVIVEIIMLIEENGNYRNSANSNGYRDNGKNFSGNGRNSRFENCQRGGVRDINPPLSFKVVSVD